MARPPKDYDPESLFSMLSSSEKRRAYIDLAKDVVMEKLTGRYAGGGITADAVHARAPVPPEFDGRILGCVFRELVKENKIERVGWDKSVRKETHYRPVAVWKLKEGAAT